MAPVSFPLTRADALLRLAQFVPQAGRAYAARRNFVSADGNHAAVSRLSAALRRRLISEQEVALAVLGAHSYDDAEKFIAEVFWRTYWKGWLEQRPQAWLDAQEPDAPADGVLARQIDAAIAGETGIEAFDHWARELAQTGYLHNWARMQVASIWVHSLRLPWRAGAAWTFARLIDADPASNTLSWRWVAGLHTAGKAYLADGARIAGMTNGRLHADGLASHASIPADAGPPARQSLRAFTAPDPAAPTLVLVTPEDLSLETELALSNVRMVAALEMPAATRFDRTALADGAQRAAQAWQAEAHTVASVEAAIAAASAAGCSQIVTGYAPVGPVADALAAARGPAAAAGIRLAEHLRAWDRLSWPHCTKGFFQLKSRIPAILDDLAVSTH